jgi:S-DNA-T family DNA segregation ATPase FtsK/SpoIIIE
MQTKSCKLPISEIEAEILEAVGRLAGSAGIVQGYADRYQEGIVAVAAARSERAGREFALLRARATAAHEAELAEIAARHEQALDDADEMVTTMVAANPWALRGFDESAWDCYAPDAAARYPDGVRVGLLEAGSAAEVPPLPAIARLAGHGHILIRCDRGQENEGRSLLQALALRLVVSAAPGMVRLALADSPGQGQHLSAFLRLPASLRAGDLAVTESEVEELLRTLSEHVSDVNKTRLTNVYETIEGYNAAATGLALPYHVLVVDSFPAGFTDRAAALLAQLAGNGPRAGVYILATIDHDVKLPRGFDLASLKSRATNLRMREQGRLSWDDEDFGQATIKSDQMPAAGRVNACLDAVATAADDENRDLPFDRITVAAAERWLGNTTGGLDVPIGVDGKGEHARFRLAGVGAAQHGLLGGGTQMGKSNLLHVLIHQLALRYSPEELELYLLDFKEVEFNVYLTERLPHARVIASRADREFGVSVLRRFRAEISRRQRLMNEVKGATNLSEYRRETGLPLPRTLLIMDEFQVLFEAGGQTAYTDRISMEAGFLLEDIARRGAGLGLHLLLSTQSPGGDLAGYINKAYQQMQLRIAVACGDNEQQKGVSEAIIGDDSATRLARPGDAIYKDPKNPGSKIRVARLDGRERVAWTTAIRNLCGDSREYPPPASFDPDVPADFAAHPACAAFAPGPVIEAWLGEPIEIKDATTATFGRDPGSSLLVVGGEDGGTRMLLATVLSAAAQRSPADVRFTVADLAPVSSPMRGVFASLAGLPHEVSIVRPRDATAALRELASDLKERLADPSEASTPERFLVIAGLRRWPDLLPDDMYGEPTAAQELLIKLLSDGPEAGIHVVAWADTYATVELLFVLDRRIRQLFALRAALHLDQIESDHLLGTDQAAQLSGDRALFRNEDRPPGEVEKFKPYSLKSLMDYMNAVTGK